MSATPTVPRSFPAADAFRVTTVTGVRLNLVQYLRLADFRSYQPSVVTDATSVPTRAKVMTGSSVSPSEIS